jgi:DNA-binding transcriptional regulator YiaG
MSNEYHYVMCGLDNVWLKNGFEITETPYGRGVKIANAEALDLAIAKHLTEKPTPLTGAEVRFLRQMLDISQKRFGELLGRTAQTVALWEKSEQIHDDADFLIRHIYRQTKINERDSYVELVDYLNSQDREAYRDGVYFTETAAGWAIAA